jgi:hypothetical protein
MPRIILLSVLAIGLFLPASAQKQTGPAFSAFSVAVEGKKAKSIDFRRSPSASTFRTRLKEALAGPVDFAGHYIVAGWGCGTGCIYSGVIDTRTGIVYFPIELAGLGVAFNETEYVDKPLEYRKNSRLLILRGSPGVMDNEADKPIGTYYYQWSNNRLRLVKFVKTEGN